MEEPPSDLLEPNVIRWFKVYCVVLAVMYLLVLLLGVAFLILDPRELELTAGEARLSGLGMIAIGLPFLIGSLAPLALEPKPWVWAFSIVLICFGMTSCCTLPMAIPLLIYWIRPETRAYFGKE